MLRFYFFCLSLHFFILSHSQQNYFRYAPGGYIKTDYNQVFDTKKWKYNTGAPVRSTPLINGNNVYIGTTKGEFLAIDKKTGKLVLKYISGYPINSSAAIQTDKIFFSDNEQTVYALNANTGKLIWKFRMGKKIDYPWRFDYYYSSPVLYESKLLIGGDDGYLYQLDQQTGKVVWKFKANGLIRSTAAIYKNTILIGDTEATFYGIDIRAGKKKWEFKIVGDTMRNENYGFDRRGIIASASIRSNKTVFGARDGFLYCVNADNGEFLWKMDHEVSWIISSVAIKDSFVVTGTSDGRFVQAVNLNTGKQIWKHKTNMAVWSSPLINNDKVYAGGYDGQLLCLDLKTGNQISEICTNGIIYSSPVISDSILFFGSDDGNLYALKGHTLQNAYSHLNKFVYADQKPRLYYRNGSDERIRAYLESNGFKTIQTDTLAKVLNTDKAGNTVVVLISIYLHKEVWENEENSLLRKFLNAGGRVIIAGNNPLFFDINDTTRDVNGLSFQKAASVLGIDFGPNDTRTFGGLFTSFTTEKGKEFNLPDFWVSNFGIDQSKVDMILGKNENGLATAYVKKYSNNGYFIQIWMNQDLPVNLDALIKLSEWKLE